MLSCGLFSGAVSNSDCITSNVRVMNEKNNLTGLLKEAGVPQVDVISLKGLDKIMEVAVWMVDATLEIPTG